MADFWVLVDQTGDGAELHPLRIHSRLHIGRECHGIAPDRRLLLDDPHASREHCEIRVDGDRAHLVDVSTNGTRLNHRKVDRNVRELLKDGDVIEIGRARLTIRVEGADEGGLASGAEARHMSTQLDTGIARAVVVVGDIIDYTGLAERSGAAAVAAGTDRLFARLRDLVVEHGGSISNFAGDALLAVWPLDDATDAAADAVRCALAADRLVGTLAPELGLRSAADEPIRMGWGITSGAVSIARPAPGREALLGDTVVLAFRLSGIAGRGGQPPVLVTEETADRAPDAAAYGDVAELSVKGRAAAARVRGARPR